MLLVLCKNELTGVISEVSEISDLALFDLLTAALADQSALPSSVFRYTIDQYTYAAIDYITISNESGNMVSIKISEEDLRSTVLQLHRFLEDQIRGYVAFSHDIQYFIGAIRQFSDPIENTTTLDKASESINNVNSIANLMAAKSKYFRFLTDDIDSIQKKRINLLEKIGELSLAMKAMSALYDKNVVTRIECRGTPHLYSVDVFEFVPLAIIENAVKYGPNGGVGILFNFIPTSRGLDLQIGSMGPTIDSSEIDQIMTRGFRASSAKRLRIPGNGIGLFQANIGASKLFQGLVSFKQIGDPRIIEDTSYSNTLVTIHMPSGNVSY